VKGLAWLADHHEIVEIEQLARLADKLRGRDSARLGLLMETAQEFVGDDVFGQVVAVCQPWVPPEPLFDVDRNSPGMTLENLKAAGLIVRHRQGRSYAISLCRPYESPLPVGR
jgi:hypothetical protein